MTDSAVLATRGFDQIRSIVGDAYLRAARSEDAIDGVQPRWIVEPGSTTEVAGVLAAANGAGLRVIPRGGGTKIDWGNPPGMADLILSTHRLDQVFEHAASDMTATVHAGCTLATFQKTLAEHGQRLAIDPLWPDRATIGGILATNNSGPLRATYGSVRDHLIGITVALTDGTIARSGGKVVKSVAGYDLPKLFIGSFGTLGVIIEATFRLYPLPKASRTLRFIVRDSIQLVAALSALSEYALITTAVQIESNDDQGFTISVMIDGLPEAIDGKVERVMRILIDHGSAAGPIQNAWPVHKRLFESGHACIASFSLLPTQLPNFCDQVHKHGVQYKIIAQAIGTGLVAFDHAVSPKVIETIASLRSWLKPLGGHLTLLRCPAELKQQIDVWPEAGSALPLMREIKQQFDPLGTLSPGRFVGGI